MNSQKIVAQITWPKWSFPPFFYFIKIEKVLLNWNWFRHGSDHRNYMFSILINGWKVQIRKTDFCCKRRFFTSRFVTCTFVTSIQEILKSFLFLCCRASTQTCLFYVELTQLNRIICSDRHLNECKQTMNRILLIN